MDDRIVELDGREGILLPADLAESADIAVERFRQYCQEVWGWDKPVTNVGVDGPHRYILYPPAPANPDDYMENARLMLPDAADDEVRAEAERIAELVSDPGGWRRSIFEIPDVDVGYFWKMRVGYIG